MTIMDAHRISCIVPVYNGERYLADTPDSILAQAYHPLEVIVADDGSTDGTARVAAAFCTLRQICASDESGIPRSKKSRTERSPRRIYHIGVVEVLAVKLLLAMRARRDEFMVVATKSHSSLPDQEEYSGL